MAKKAQSTLINMFLSLTIIAVVAAAALALVSNVTTEPIAQAQKAKKEAAVKAVLPAFVSTQELDIEGTPCTQGLDVDGNVTGIAVEAFSDKGFGGRLTAMVGFDTTGTITGYQILQTSETPGLGAKAAEWFQEGGKGNVVGKNPSNEPSGELKVKKDNGTVDAISGSTITSRAFCELVNKAFQVVNTFSNDQQKGDIE